MTAQLKALAIAAKYTDEYAAFHAAASPDVVLALIAERDEYRKCADDQAMAHKIERDELIEQLDIQEGSIEVVQTANQRLAAKIKADEAMMREALDALEWEQGGEPCGGQDAINALKRRLKMNDALIPQELLYKALPKKPTKDKPTCNPHPDAPHGFNRNASHDADRYVCDCEGWTP
jgi:hypothetical protein